MVQELKESPVEVAKILVVDDDPEFLKLIKMSLEEEGYRILCGFDGQMALHLARLEKPDLILMDVKMPLISGLKAFQYLRRNIETSRIPVILLSGEIPAEEVYAAIGSAQRVAHIRKPMELDYLHSIVRAFLSQYTSDKRNRN